ncbi:MAG TPA: ECF transporter S component [Microbacteriaceae bacterium]|nr:ECF transporter S component [Microbacteriaceae bacterium]
MTTRITRSRWRVVDIVVAAVLGVVLGLVFFLWNQLYNPLSAPLEAALPGLQALTYGVWLVGGVLGGLIIRKPGAALFVELVAASVSALLGAQWAFLTLEAGLVQGLGAELIFLLFRYRSWSPLVAVLAGALAGLAMAVNDLILWYPGAGSLFMTMYTISSVISGAVIAGLGSWLLARALAKTGVLSRFASGREVRGREAAARG